jgi:hypothetical protein
MSRYALQTGVIRIFTSSGFSNCSFQKAWRSTETIQSNWRNGTTFQVRGASESADEKMVSHTTVALCSRKASVPRAEPTAARVMTACESEGW